jgi:hypothetical protein
MTGETYRLVDVRAEAEKAVKPILDLVAAAFADLLEPRRQMVRGLAEDQARLFVSGILRVWEQATGQPE